MSSVLSPDADREAWLAARRKGIGASEIAAVLGISPWESPFSLYWRKVEGWDFEPDAAMEWGNRLEDAIAAKYQSNHPEGVVHPLGLQSNANEPWMLATPDRVVCDPQMHDNPFPDDPTFEWQHSDLFISGVVELKTAHSADGWGEPGTADIPVHYRAQVLWQMAALDVQWADLAVLIGGSDYREYTVLRDEKDIAVMVEAGRRFMARIEAGDPPPLDDHHATLATVKRLHPDLDDDVAVVPDGVAEGYRRAVRMSRLADRAKDRYEILLRAEMGRAKRATTAAGLKVATRTVSEIAESTVTRAAHRRDYLTPAKEPKP